MKLVAAVLTSAWLAVGTAHAGPPLIRAEVEPATVGVGDTFSYVVEARLDAKGLDTSSVRIFADTGPFAQVGPTNQAQHLGSAVVVRLEQRLSLPRSRLRPGPGLRRIRLPGGARERARRRRRRDDGASRRGRGRRRATRVDRRRPRCRAAVQAADGAARRNERRRSPGRAARGRGRDAGLVAVLLAALGLWPRGRARARRGAACTGAPSPPRIGQATGSGSQARGGPRSRAWPARRERSRWRAMPRALRGPRASPDPEAPSGSPSALKERDADERRARSRSQTSVG